MIPDLAHKAVDEKYFNSIRFFSHFFKGEKRATFITELSEYNIYLAAQCLMSSEKEIDLEDRIKTKAEEFAKEFENAPKSAKGFLALAEFESFELILNLITSISKPSKIHQEVFNKIFAESNSSGFLKFFEVLLKANKPLLMTYLISAFNKEIIVSSENKKLLKNIFNYFLLNKLFGLFRIFIEKFELHTEVEFILDNNIEEFVGELMNQASYKVIKLCYFLVTSNNRFETYSPTFFVESLAKHKVKKATMFAIKLCVTHNLKSIPELDNAISKFIRPTSTFKSSKKNINAVKQFINSGLLKYAKNDEQFLLKIESFISEFTVKKKPMEDIDELIEFRIMSEYNSSYFYNSCNNLEELFEKYFRDSVTRKTLKLEDIIKTGVERFSSSLMEISHLLRKYEFTGAIKYKRDFGCYISSEELNTLKLPFIHNSQIYEQSSQLKFSDVKEGELIKFRIIGVNQESYRINTSALVEFKPSI